MDKRTICLLNDSFPPEIDGVANAVVNYAKNITKSGENAIVVTPTMPGADDSAFPFPVLRYPSIDTRKKLGYVAGYPFSPETARVLTEQKVELMHTHCPISSCLLARSLRAVVDAPLVLTYHTKYDVDIAKAVRGKLLQESAIRALVQNIASCEEVWVVSRGAGENLRSLGYEGDYIVMENGEDVPRNYTYTVKELNKPYASGPTDSNAETKTPAEAGYSVSVKYGTDKDGKYVATVTNFSPLPETGGNGTLQIVMLGVLMLALGTAWYLRANRMEPAAAGGAGAGTALPVGRKRGRHTR